MSLVAIPVLVERIASARSSDPCHGAAWMKAVRWSSMSGLILYADHRSGPIPIARRVFDGHQHHHEPPHHVERDKTACVEIFVGSGFRRTDIGPPEGGRYDGEHATA